MSSHQATGEYAPSNSSVDVKFIFAERATGSRGLQVEINIQSHTPYTTAVHTTRTTAVTVVLRISCSGLRVSNLIARVQASGCAVRNSDSICDLQKAAANVSSRLFHEWDVQHVSTLSELLCPLIYTNRSGETGFGSWRNFPALETCFSTPELPCERKASSEIV